MGQYVLPHSTIIPENTRSISLVSERPILASDKSFQYKIASLLSNVLLQCSGEALFLSPLLGSGFCLWPVKIPHSMSDSSLSTWTHSAKRGRQTLGCKSSAPLRRMWEILKQEGSDHICKDTGFLHGHAPQTSDLHLAPWGMRTLPTSL